MKALDAQAHIAELTRRGASESRLPKLNFMGTVGQQGLSAPEAIPDYVIRSASMFPFSRAAGFAPRSPRRISNSRKSTRSATI